jgi:hypothetical protein
MLKFFGYAALLTCSVALPARSLAQTSNRAASANTASAIAPPHPPSDTVGYYDANALRVEARGQEVRIYRGITGPIIAQTGVFRSFDLTRIVSPSENAMREAREFNRNYGPGMFATATGGFILGVAFLFDLNSDPNWAIATGELGGAAVALYGARRLNLSYSALSKSVWWYNRDLKK